MLTLILLTGVGCNNFACINCQLASGSPNLYLFCENDSMLQVTWQVLTIVHRPSYFTLKLMFKIDSRVNFAGRMYIM